MPARYRLDYFELLLETTCGVCGHSFMESPDIDYPEYKCPKCDQLYKVNFKITPISKIELIKKDIRLNMTPNPPFNAEDS
jgi:phage FluMu protein Com